MSHRNATKSGSSRGERSNSTRTIPRYSQRRDMHSSTSQVDIEEGASFLARAVKLDPNLVVARHWSGYVQLWLGNIDAAIGQFEIAMRLNPLDPRMYNSQTGLACAHFLAGRFGEATLWAEAAVRLLPSFVPAHFVLAACHAMSGRAGEARAVCARAVQLDPTVNISNIPNWRPYRRPEDVEKWSQAFRIAGMPE